MFVLQSLEYPSIQSQSPSIVLPGTTVVSPAGQASQTLAVAAVVFENFPMAHETQGIGPLDSL